MCQLEQAVATHLSTNQADTFQHVASTTRLESLMVEMPILHRTQLSEVIDQYTVHKTCKGLIG